MQSRAQQGSVTARDAPARRHIPALTGIRGLAALWVVLLHLSTTGKFLGVAAFASQVPLMDNGYLGVDLFFVLSGFVLMMTHGIAVSSGWSGVRDFAIGRVFRILPLHWTVLLLFVTVSPIMGGQWLTTEPHDVENLTIAASLLQTALHRSTVWNTPAWSLSAEWICYFLFPAAALAFVRTENRLILWAGIVGPMVALFFFAAMRHGPVTLGMTNRDGIARCAAEMVTGMALCRICVLSPPSRRAGNAMVVAGFALLAVALTGSPADFVAMPAFAMLIAACYGASSIASGLFGNRVVHWLGQISFSIYILHWLLFEIAAHVVRAWRLSGDAALLAILLPPAVLLPLAWLLWRQVEVRGQAAGRAVIAHMRARDAALSPVGRVPTSSAR